MGLFVTFTNGFGTKDVRGINLDPLPPAKIIADHSLVIKLDPLYVKLQVLV